MDNLRSSFVWIFYILLLVLLYPPALIIWVLTVLFDKRLWLLHKYSCFWASTYTWLNPFWRISIEGKENIDHGGVYRLIDSQRQIIPKKLPEELNQSIYSNLICFREWFIVYDGMGIQGYCNKYSEILSYPDFDPYIRSFHTHPYGVFTGDDEGKIRFCVLGKLSLERSYEPD